MKYTLSGGSGMTLGPETYGPSPMVTIELTDVQYDQLLVIVGHYAETCPINLTPYVRELELALRQPNEPVA